jgi:uncharacterized membrane protein
MKLALPAIMLVIAIAACNTNTNTTTDANASVKDTVGVIPDSSGYNSSFITPPGDTVLFGFYHGVLPCKDCQGIKHTLLLKDSGRFKLEEFTLGKNTFPEKEEGRWARAGDSIRLMANQKLIATYFILNDTLKLRFREGMAITDSLAKNYWIARHPNAAYNAAWRKKAEQGVDFYAIGNEPFWNLEISKQSISFKIADLPKPVTATASAPRVTKDSSFYSANDLQITIYNEFCSDGMSDNLYEHRVHVVYKGETFKGCGVRFRK